MLPAHKFLCIPKSSPTHHHASRLGPMCSPSQIQHNDLPFELNLWIFVLSLKIMCFQSSMVQISNLWANLRRVRTCLRLRNGFLCCTCAPNPTFLKVCLIVMPDNNLHVSDWSWFAIADAVTRQPSVTRVTKCLFSRFARSFGRPCLCLSI